MAEKYWKKKDLVIRGRNFKGAESGGTEPEQTRKIEQARRPDADEADEFVTDAEIEAREKKG